jgi:hypothetical protein
MSINDERNPSAVVPFRRRSTHRGVLRAAPAQPPADLEAEVTLLREDNARLKAAQHRPADLGSVLEKVRALPGTGPDAGQGDLGDDAAQMLAEGLVLRDSLLSVCTELSQSIASLEARLRSLPPAVA